MDFPLDNRAEYVRLSTGNLERDFSDPAHFKSLIDPIGKWIDDPSRVPLRTGTTPKQQANGFSGPVGVGGVFIKLLADKEMAAKWLKFVPQPVKFEG
jgi:hypothetical protein